MTITAIRGFNDILPSQLGEILPGDSRVFRHIENTAFDIFSSYGFHEIRLPVAEKTELFKRGIGDTTDIVEKEMYTFLDRNGESLTLRPEGTASVVRAYIEHKRYVSPATRLYYAGPMFRYERPQKGRYRQFYQIGAEVLGDPSAGTDAETIGMLLEFFKKIGINTALHINSLGCHECRPVYKETLKAFLKGVEDRLCDNCRRRMDANPLRSLDCKGAGCIEATQNAPKIIDSICNECSAHFVDVKSGLADLNIPFNVNSRMVRGLDYYTKTTFEVIAEGLGSQNAVGAGGRYDKLVEDLGGPPTPCFGFAVGVERIALLMGGGNGPLPPPLCVFIAMGAEATRKGAKLCGEWRDKNVVSVIRDFSDKPLKGRMKNADKLGARYAIILGEDEMRHGVVTIKDMKTAEQEKVAWDNVVAVIADKIAEKRRIVAEGLSGK